MPWVLSLAATLTALGALLATLQARAATVVPTGTTYVLTATSGFPDNGPVTVMSGGTLETDTTNGSFSVGSTLIVSGIGADLPGTPFQRAALYVVGANPGLVTITGNVLIAGTASIATANPYTNGPQYGSLLIAGPISATGTTPALLIIEANNPITVTGVISDGPSAQLTLNVSSNVTLTGNNTYSGGTALEGPVRIFSDANLGAPSGPVYMTDGSLEFAGNVASARTLIGSLGGVFTVPSALTADAGTSSILSGILSGNEWAVNGPGSLTLAGTVVPIVGALPVFTIAGGTVIVANANLFCQCDGQMLNFQAGTLETNRVVHTVSVPTYAQSSGATLQLRQLSATRSEQVQVGGAASLGGTLRILSSGAYAPQNGDQYVALTAGSVTGQFNAVLGPPGFFARATYAPTSVIVQDIALSSFATDANGFAVAQALMRGAQAGLPGALFASPGVFYGLSPSQPIGAYLDQLTPQRFEVFRNIAFDSASFLASALPEWRAQGRNGDEPGWHSFVGAPGTLATVGGAPAFGHAQYDSAGVIVGADYMSRSDLDVGVLLDYQDAAARLDLEGSRGEVHSLTPALFAAYTSGGFNVQALLAESFNDYTSDRRIEIAGTLNETAQGSTSGHAPSASLGAGYDIARGDVRFGPIANATYTHLTIDGFRETNAPVSGLVVGYEDANSFRTQLGGHVALAGADGFWPHLDLSLGWQHEFLSGAANVFADFLQPGSGGFVTALSSLKGDAVFGGLAITGHLSRAIEAFLSYQIQSSRIETAHNFVGGFKVTF